MPRRRSIPEIMSAGDLARYLQFSYVGTLRKLERGTLPGAKLGHQWRIRKQDIDAMFLWKSPIHPRHRASQMMKLDPETISVPMDTFVSRGTAPQGLEITGH